MDFTSYSASREARAATAAHHGPTAERYHGALDRYLAAIASTERPSKDRRSPNPSGAPRRNRPWSLAETVVADVMTTDVATVGPDAPFKEIVDTLTRRRVSAVPVVDDTGRVLGVISESDLIARVVATDAESPRLRADRALIRGLRRPAQAETARELMHAPAIVTHAQTSVVEAARAAGRARVRRLPVVDHRGALIGIVTRSDVLKLYLRSDEGIATHLREDVLVGQFCLDPTAFEVRVVDGIVTITGQLENAQLRDSVLTACSATAGVVAVHDHLTSATEHSGADHSSDGPVGPPPPLAY